jgi:hypothetical protein
MSAQSRNSTLAADLIWGVSGEHGIAAEINRSKSETYYLIASGALGDAVQKLGPARSSRRARSCGAA